MASSKVVTTNPDLARDSSSISSSLSTLLFSSDLHPHSNSMDDLLNSIYPTTTTTTTTTNTNTSPSSSSSSPPSSSAVTTKTADDVWKEIVAGSANGTHSQTGAEGAGEEALEGMTLEDFLTKAGAVREEDVRGVTIDGGATAQFAVPVEGSSSVEAFGNGVEGMVVGAAVSASASGLGGGGGGKGKRRSVEEPVDKATLQKQRRMIKNRESAARSRERKQAYTTELEYLVQQLEQENARLLSEEADKQQQRYKQLMECLIPIVERREPKRRLRRTNSVQSM